MKVLVATSRTQVPWDNDYNWGIEGAESFGDTLRTVSGMVDELRVGWRGNLQIRACRSFVRLLNPVPPAELVLVAPEGRRDHGVILSEELEGRTTWRDPDDASELDVLPGQWMRTRPYGL